MRSIVLFTILLLVAAGSPAVAQPCTGLCLQQVVCPGGATTSVSGTIFAPNGTLPMPDVLVYVPNAPVTAFAEGVQCTTPVTGAPLVTATSAVDGKFTLTNMPVGANIPLVIQAGKWRRQLTIDNVAACTDTAVPAARTNLPRDKTQGDIPKIAMVTGSVDVVECTLRKFGLQDSEFSRPSGTGRVHIYLGSGGAGASAGAATPSETTLWSSQSMLNSYDLTLLGCQGAAYSRTAAELTALGNYANAGGRVLGTHYAFSYLNTNPAFAGTVIWHPDQAPPADQPGLVNTSFPKGLRLAEWLQTVGASTTLGQIPLQYLRTDLDGVLGSTQSWIRIDNPSIPVQISFNTPVGAPPADQCGRVQFNEYHISDANSSGKVFPAECAPGPMTPQETMLAFSLFDLSSTTITPAIPSTLTLTATHLPATFTQGGPPGTVTIDVHNPSPTIVLDHRLTLTAAIPNGLALVGMAGTTPTTGWTCDTATARCTRATPLAVSSSDPVALTLDVTPDAPVGGPLTLTATAESGGLAALVTQSESIPIRVVPALAWTAPAALTWPAALDAAQLNASASYNGNAVAGLFAYAPAAGSVLDAGTHTLSVDFTPDDAATYADTNATTTLTIHPAATATTLAANPNATVFGQSAMLSANVSLPGGLPNGTVAFADGGTPVPGCGAVPVAAGSAACQAATLAVGTHAIAAAYLPADGNTLASTSADATVTVGKAPTAITLTPPAPITLGNPANVSAFVAVVAPGAGAPGGVIAIDDGSGATCSLTLPATSCALTPISAGAKTLTATFTPDAASSANFDGSAASGSLTVHPAQAGAALASSANPSVYGQAVMLTATVTPATGSAVPTTGNGLAFRIDGDMICAGSTLAPTGVANAARATCAVPQASLAVGMHAVTFDYGGDGNALATSATLIGGQAVNAAATNLSIDALAAITLGQPVDVTVHVAVQAPGAGTPIGSVTIHDGSANCVATLASGSGHCRLTPPAPAGAHQIGADYAATTNFAASTGHATLTVNAATAGTVLASDVNPSTFGQTVTLTATVTPASGNPTPTGTVDFHDGAAPIAGCAGMALNAGVAACATAGLAVGSHALQANYGGDANTAPSASTLQQQVAAAATTTTLVAAPAPASTGEAVTLTATVTSNAGVPGGTVTFLDGDAPIGSALLDASGVATLTLPALAAGTHAIAAHYGGDGSHAPSNAAFTLQVNAIAVPAEPTSVPALSGGTIALLGLLLAVLGLRRRAKHVS
ncbi:Ig-like domain-containing protein [Dokdonella sp.]|uniref:Ig-like domain-containing protein n=1 Tax=Dokdonella sp. TaxID=2291710 RepID=UPI00262009DA|nr:Ig-like domain-containing protein [Dokdonella sp.]